MAKQQSNSKNEQKQEKLDRLSKALKDNLKRRKTQAKKITHNDVKDN